MKEASQIEEQDLLQYIEGTLDGAQQHRLEAILENDPFLSDAVEGLAAIKDEATIKMLTHQINTSLRNHIQQKKHKRRHKSKIENKWSWIFVIIVLMIVLCVWWVVYFLLK
jgi:anti-sigma factor RsiW